MLEALFFTIEEECNIVLDNSRWGRVFGHKKGAVCVYLF
jgi:hypothetical protein